MRTMNTFDAPILAAALARDAYHVHCANASTTAVPPPGSCRVRWRFPAARVRTSEEAVALIRQTLAHDDAYWLHTEQLNAYTYVTVWPMVNNKQAS